MKLTLYPLPFAPQEGFERAICPSIGTWSAFFGHCVYDAEAENERIQTMMVRTAFVLALVMSIAPLQTGHADSEATDAVTPITLQYLDNSGAPLLICSLRCC